MHDWQADFSIFDRSGQLTAVVEIKPSFGELETAVGWFHLYTQRQHGRGPRFVILATAEKLYVWQRDGESPSQYPIAMVATRPLFAAYLRNGHDPATLASPAFEFLVGAWLTDMSNGLWQPAPEDVQPFVHAGVLDVIENGRVVADVAA
jgi:hypothetical protein